MREVVAVASDRRLAHLAISDDPFFHRLTPDKASEAVGVALAAGESAGKSAKARWGRDPERIAATLNLPIIRSADPARTGTAVLFSEYGDKPPSVILHTHSISDVNRLISEHALADLLGIADVAPVHLTHELYHHLESQRLVPGTAGFRVRTLSFGPIRLSSGLPSLSEIAADRFAAVVLDLKVPPRALSFITAYALRRDYAWALLDRLKNLPV